MRICIKLRLTLCLLCPVACVGAQNQFVISSGTTLQYSGHLLFNNVDIINQGEFRGDSASLLVISSTGSKQYSIRTPYPGSMRVNKLSIKGNVLTGYDDTIYTNEVILGGKLLVGGVLFIQSGSLTGETKDRYCRTSDNACIVAPDISLESGKYQNILGLGITSAGSQTTTIIRQHDPVIRQERGNNKSTSVNKVYTFADPVVLNEVEFGLQAEDNSNSGTPHLAYLGGSDWEFFPKALLASPVALNYKASNLVNIGPIQGVTAFGFSGIYAPEFITPNGDGINDCLKFSGLEFIDQPSLVVLHPKGHVVAKIDHYNNDFSGENISAGPYYYILYSDGTPLKKGYVEIIK